VEVPPGNSAAVKHPITFAWIDDTPQRERLLSHLVDAAPPGVTASAPIFVGLVKGKDQSALTGFLGRRTEPSLVVIDQVLNKCEWELKIPLLGSSLAEIIRQKWPACPIVGITAGQNIATESQWYDFEKRSEFEELIEAQNFGAAIELIYALALGFQLLRGTKSLSLKKIIAFVKPPSGEHERVATAIPDKMRSSSKDRSVPRLTSSWIRKRLMERPGFLYDREWTANLLGLSTKGFNKVEQLFVSAKYSGVFSEPSDPRWWTLALKETLFKTVKNAETNLTWIVGQKLPGLERSDYSVCYVCKELHPEILGYVDTSSDDRRPMHIRCTIPDPRFQSLLYYDDMRVMKG
jgi:hypothetical protein